MKTALHKQSKTPNVYSTEIPKWDATLNKPCKEDCNFLLPYGMLESKLLSNPLGRFVDIPYYGPLHIK